MSSMATRRNKAKPNMLKNKNLFEDDDEIMPTSHKIQSPIITPLK